MRYAMPQKSTIKHAGCFENKPVERRVEQLKPVQFKFDKSYREITFLVNENNVVKYVELQSLVCCILVSDTVMVGVINTLYSEGVQEREGKRVVPFERLHDICDAIVARKVDVRAKNRAKAINTLTDKCYMLHVDSFPLDRIKQSITNTASAIANAKTTDEQSVKLVVRNLIQDLTSLIGD